jgi:hypothetical protein
MRKLRTDLRRLVDGTIQHLKNVCLSDEMRQKKSFERVMKQLDAFNANPSYAPKEFLKLIDEVIQMMEEVGQKTLKKNVFALHQSQLDLFLIQVYYQILKYSQSKRIAGYDLSDQALVEALDKIYHAFLKKMGETDLKKFKCFRDSLEKSRLKTVVNFLVNIQSRRGLDGLLELRDYLHKLKKELGSKADSK